MRFASPQSRRNFLRLALASVATSACGGAASGSDASEQDVSGPVTGARAGAPLLVLGAGLSGLAAARRLKERGFTNVVVLEARDRIGGRIVTDRTTGTPFDMGAAWVHYANDPTNPLLGMVKAAGLSPRVTNWDSLFAYDEVDGRITAAALASGETSIERALKDGAQKVKALKDPHVALEPILAPLLAARFAGASSERLLAFLRAYYLENEYAADLADLGAYELVTVEASTTKEHDYLVGGYDRLLASLADGLDVRLGTVVHRVRHHVGGVTVETSRGAFSASKVIVTLPVGVLRAGGVEFEPALPTAKQDALADIGVGDFEKVVLLFDEPFWPKSPHAFGYAAATADVAPLWLNVQAVAGAPALVAMLSGHAARAASAASDEDLTARTMAQVRAMFGDASPAPRSVLRTRWHDDPFARGAYSFPGPHALDTAIRALAAPVEGRLLFAGEATHVDWYSFAHGAYLSGVRAANEV